MSPLQIILAVFAVFALWRVAGRYRARQIPLIWTIVWGLAWVVLAVIALLPQTTDLLAAQLGVGRGVDLIVYISIAALFFLVFKLIVKLERQQQEMTKLVRAIALKDLVDEKELDA